MSCPCLCCWPKLLARLFSTSAVADVDEDEDVKKGRAESEKAEFTLAEVNRVTEQMDAEWGRDLSLSENLEHVSDLIDRDVITTRVTQIKMVSRSLRVVICC